jgi:hypothetical protein
MEKLGMVCPESRGLDAGGLRGDMGSISPQSDPEEAERSMLSASPPSGEPTIMWLSALWSALALSKEV